MGSIIAPIDYLLTQALEQRGKIVNSKILPVAFALPRLMYACENRLQEFEPTYEISKFH